MLQNTAFFILFFFVKFCKNELREIFGADICSLKVLRVHHLSRKVPSVSLAPATVLQSSLQHKLLVQCPEECKVVGLNPTAGRIIISPAGP